MLKLFYWPTPNGKKVTIQLAECGLDYDVIPLKIAAGDQFDSEFLKMNPNARMPLLVDEAPQDGGKPISIFESGAILIYLAEKTGQFWSDTARGRANIVQWVMWQMANQGPKTGERNHFHNFAADKGDQSYAQKRFDDEVNRIYGVLNNALYQSKYLAGDDYSIADMACYPWASGWERQGQDITEFAYVKRWLDTLAARPAVESGMAVGADYSVNPADYSEEERAKIMKMLFNQRALPVKD